MKRLSTLIFLFAIIGGCTSSLVLDTSIDAFAAGDYTLLASACAAVPGRGMDVCQVTRGEVISSSWNLVVPPQGSGIQGGEIDVYYRDVHRQYAIGTSSVVSIPWSDFFQATNWSDAQDGEVEALLVVRWKDDTGIIRTTKFRGLAKIIVTSPGYDRMPIDSGFSAWGTDCKIQYSTAGRSAIACQ